MTKNNLKTENYIQSKHLDKTLLSKFSKNFNIIEERINKDIKNPKHTLNVLSKNYKFNFSTKDLNKFKKFKKIAIIGMGGSILGANSIYKLLQSKIKKDFFFFDDIDPKKNVFFKKNEKLKKILFIIISKSGTTTETLSNFLSLKILKKKAKNIIIISEKKESPLQIIARKYNLFFVEHKKNIGGRYSILSEVGMIPAYLMGLNIFRLRSGILNFLNNKKKIFLKDSAVKLANLLEQRKIKNIIFLNYAPELEKFLLWCQQLIAESLGKKEKGFLPMISSVPKDHHSLLQLYLDGPKDKLFHIFSINSKTNEQVVTNKILKNKYFLNKKKLNVIKEAQKNALIQSLKKKEIPFREFEIKNISETTLGELFSYFMLETIIIGELTNINPYNQPAVEQVKILTKKNLT